MLRIRSLDVERNSKPLWNQKLHCRVHESPPLGAILNQLNTFRSLTSNLLRSHLRLGLSSGLFPSDKELQ
jgi:hypothetical protein